MVHVHVNSVILYFEYVVCCSLIAVIQNRLDTACYCPVKVMHVILPKIYMYAGVHQLLVSID